MPTFIVTLLIETFCLILSCALSLNQLQHVMETETHCVGKIVMPSKCHHCVYDSNLSNEVI